MQSTSLHILLIEDDLTDALMLQHQLEEDRMNAFTITSAESLADGMALLAYHKFDAVLLDLSLPDGHGMEVFQRMLAQAPNPPIVVCASHRQEEEAIQAVRNGAQDYLIKSLKGFDLTARTIRHAIDRGFAQRKIRASEKHWRALLEQSNDAIVMLGADGKIHYESPAAFHILGYAPGEMAGKHWNEFIYAEDRAIAEQNFARVMANPGQPVQSQARFIRKDGSICWIEATSTNWLHDDDLHATIINYRDITVRKQADEKLRQSEERFRLAFENASIGMCLVSLEGILLQVNTRMADMFGYSPAELAGMSVNALAVPEDAALSTSFIEQAIQGYQNVAAFEKGYYHKQGHVIYGLVSSSLVRDTTSQPLYFISQVMDITERKKTERSLQNRNAEMSLLLEAGRALSETLDRHQIYSLIYDYITRVVPCDILIISSFDPHTELLTCEYLHTGDTPQDVSGFPAIPLEPPGRGAQSQVIRSGISMLMPDFEAATQTSANNYYFDEQAQIIDDIPDNAERARSAIIVPLRVEGQVTGAMQVLSVRQNAHTEDHLRFVETLAFRISAALSNVQLFAELEQRVAERTAEVHDLYDNAPTGYHSLDSNGKFIVINQTELNWLGYAREQVIGRLFENFITEPSIAIFREAFPVFKQRGWQRDLEFEMVRRDGSTFCALVNATAIYDQDGNYLSSRSTVFDHTQRKQAEIALRESEQQSRLLFEESPDAMILLDQHGQIVQMNHVCEILTGMPSAQFVRQYLKNTGLLPDDLYRSLVDLVSQSFHSPEEVVTFEIKLQHLGGELRDISARVFALNLHGNRHYLASLRDVTISRQAAEALHYANAEMERAMKLKDEFLANMSHELRTPLHGILALSESLLEQIRGPLNERQQKSLRAIESSGKHLLSLINDLLDLSKIEAGKIELLIEKVLVEDICRSSLSFVQEMASKKRIHILYNNNQPAAKVQADARRLKQMLVNLLGNAVKFTPESGHVDLTVRVVPEEQAIRFEIQDTGPGILPADQSKLFQPFTQLDSRLARQFEGTGLGLVLVKRLANQHGGTVHVESEGVPGQGSCFILSLPYNIEKIAPPEQHLAAPVAIPIQHAGVQVLLVEDNNVNIEVVNDYLEYAGYQVIIARTGIEALDLAATNAPAMILMDIQIPDIDGLEVTSRLRAQPRYANTPIIALTASAMTGDRERCLQAGATEYMSKPLRMKELLEMIERLLK